MATVPTPIASVPSVFGTSNTTGTTGVNNQNLIPTMPTSTTTPTQAAQANPYVPTLNLPGSQSSAISTYNGNYTVAGDFTQTYGQGTGTALINTLAGLGTATDSAVQNTATASYNQALKASAGIDSKLAASGISKDSSTSALSQGDFWSSWSDGLNSTISQMELGEENTLISTLMDEGKAHGGDSSWTDSIGDLFSLGTSAAGAVSEGMGVGGTAGSILDTIGMLAI